jgi:outer membrane protein assembly factor BamB
VPIARDALLAVGLGALSGCAAHNAPASSAFATYSDPRVTIFRADRQREWAQFRLGGGLDVVVVNPQLPQAPAWRFPTGGISSSPTVDGTAVLVASNDEHLYDVDGGTGRLLWRYHAENDVMSQPAYNGSLVYVGIGNEQNTVFDPPYYAVVGTGMNKLEAIDARTGIEQWWAGLAATGMPSQGIAGNTVIALDGAGNVLAVDAQTGAYRWRTRVPSFTDMTSVLDDGRGHMFFAGEFPNDVYALRTSDGRLLWRHPFDERDGAFSDGPLALSGGTIVGMYLHLVGPGPFGNVVTQGARAHQHVYALQAGTGSLLWDVTIPGSSGVVPNRNEASIPLIYGGTIYIGSSVAPVVSALTLTGKIVWQFRTAGVVKGGIAAVDGVLYFGDLSGDLWAVDARTGRAIGHIATDMHFNVGSPIIVNGSLIIGGLKDVIAVPLENVRSSRAVASVTQLGQWERVRRLLLGLIPQRDPHREASYYTHP